MILDTNVVSETLKPEPARSVLTWLSGHSRRALHLTAITEAELLYGVAVLPEGRRRDRLARLVGAAIEAFEDRVLPFDRAAATRYAFMAAERRTKGRPAHRPDIQIAAIASAQGHDLATRNVRDFEGLGVRLVNPFDV